MDGRYDLRDAVSTHWVRAPPWPIDHQGTNRPLASSSPSRDSAAAPGCQFCCNSSPNPWVPDPQRPSTTVLGLGMGCPTGNSGSGQHPAMCEVRSGRLMPRADTDDVWIDTLAIKLGQTGQWQGWAEYCRAARACPTHLFQCTEESDKGWYFLYSTHAALVLLLWVVLSFGDLLPCLDLEKPLLIQCSLHPKKYNSCFSRRQWILTLTKICAKNIKHL